MPEGTPYVSSNYPKPNLQKIALKLWRTHRTTYSMVEQERNTLKIRKKMSGKKRITRVEKKEVARLLSDRATL